MDDVTRILSAIERGEEQAAGRLLPLVYDELRRLAARRLAHERPGQTLQATALVHEAYLRLVGPEALPWNSRGHFFAAAAEAMRRILVEVARRKGSGKGGGSLRRVGLDAVDVPEDAPSEDILALDEALARLAAEDPTKAELVKLRFFGGLSVEDAGRALGISRATADRYWAYARAWLYSELNGPALGGASPKKSSGPRGRGGFRFRTVRWRQSPTGPSEPGHEPESPRPRRDLLRRPGAGPPGGACRLPRREPARRPRPPAADRAAPRRPSRGGPLPRRPRRRPDPVAVPLARARGPRARSSALTG